METFAGLGSPVIGDLRGPSLLVAMITADAVRSAMSDLRYDGLEPAYLLVDGSLTSSTSTSTTETDDEDDGATEDGFEDFEADGGQTPAEVAEETSLDLITADALPVDADAVVIAEEFDGGVLL